MSKNNDVKKELLVGAAGVAIAALITHVVPKAYDFAEEKAKQAWKWLTKKKSTSG